MALLENTQHYILQWSSLVIFCQGPASNPEANCGHFQWAPGKSKEKSSKEKRQ